MKYVIIWTILVIHCSCGGDKRSNTFSYHQAIKDLQGEITKLEDSSIKNDLLWQVERILNEDTLYRHKLAPNSFDSLMFAVKVAEFQKYVYQQLELRDLSKLTIEDRIESYKLTYNRAFSRETVLITISNQDDNFPILKTQIYFQDYDCHPIVGTKIISGSCFKIKLNEARKLTESEWLEFQHIIKDNQFWTIPETDEKEGLDGSEWLLEGTMSVKDSVDSLRQVYKKVYRWSPDEHSPVYAIGLFLLRKNNYDYGKIY